MKKRILVRGPAMSRSGYGEQSRFCLRALRAHEDKFDIWGSYNRGEDAVTDESPDELIYNHTCLFLSINEENLDMKKGPYTRYKKVNKRKLEERVHYLSGKSFDMTNCNLD